MVCVRESCIARARIHATARARARARTLSPSRPRRQVADLPFSDAENRPSKVALEHPPFCFPSHARPATAAPLRGAAAARAPGNGRPASAPPLEQRGEDADCGRSASDSPAPAATETAEREPGGCGSSSEAVGQAVCICPRFAQFRQPPAHSAWLPPARLPPPWHTPPRLCRCVRCWDNQPCSGNAESA